MIPGWLGPTELSQGTVAIVVPTRDVLSGLGQSRLIVSLLHTPKRFSNSTTLTMPRRWVPSPILRSPSQASTSNTTLLPLIWITRAMARTVRPAGVAGEVPDPHVHADADEPLRQIRSDGEPDAISICRIIIGVGIDLRHVRHEMTDRHLRGHDHGLFRRHCQSRPYRAHPCLPRLRSCYERAAISDALRPRHYARAVVRPFRDYRFVYIQMLGNQCRWRMCQPIDKENSS